MAGAGLALWNIAQQVCVLHSKGGRLLEASEPWHLTALDGFDKAGVIAAHSRLRNSAAFLERRNREDGIFATALPSHLDPLCKPVSLHSSSSSLKSVTLKDLEPGTWNQGCKLRGTIQVSAFKFSNIAVSALEDETGSTARILALNSVHWDATPSDVEEMYPQGAQVVIREPTLARVEFCEGTALWLPNPASMEFTSFSSLGQSRINANGNHWINLGIERLKTGDFGQAIDCFTQCVRQEGERELCGEAYSFRAEAWLGMIGSYVDKALGDCEQGLAINPVHSRCLFIKGLALRMQGQYEESHRCIQLAADKSNTGKIKLALGDSFKFKEQSLTGTGYEDKLSKYYLAGCREADAPKMADYVGPVKISMTSDGKGRGLFLTKDIPKGEVVIVSNAVSLVFPKSDVAKLDRGGMLLNEVLRECIGSIRTLAQVETLAERNLQTGESISKQVPSMDLFLPNINIRKLINPVGLKVDVARVSNIVTCVSETSLEEDVLVSGDSLGLWTLPSFMNHSCLPNVSINRVGRTLLVITSTDLCAGTELLRSYGSVLTPWNPMRREEMLHRGCKCQRCILEEKLMIPLEDLSSRYDVTLKAESMLEDEFFQEMGKVALDLEVLLDYDPDLTRQHKNWLRASYWLAYLCYYCGNEGNGHFDVSRGVVMPRVEEVMEALHMTAPGSNKTLMAMCCFEEHRKNNAKESLVLLEQECMSLCGKHTPEVTKSVIQQARSKGKSMFW